MSATSTKPQAVDAVLELLQDSDPSVWTNQKPEAYHYFAHSQSERGPGHEMPPYLYVWNPTDGDIQQFDAENSHQLEYLTVEIQVWTLDEQDATLYQRDLLQFMSEYARDNYEQTRFHQIRPTTQSDYRSEKPARPTDHYVTGVEVETEDLQGTGV
jgi:hypothetical protein